MLRYFQLEYYVSIINERQRKQTALCSRTAKIPKENRLSYNVSERSGDGAKQKRGNSHHWRRRWADSRIIWRKYYRGGIQGASGGRESWESREAHPGEVNYPPADKAAAR